MKNKYLFEALIQSGGHSFMSKMKEIILLSRIKSDENDLLKFVACYEEVLMYIFTIIL